jgi:hypothetical protein
MNLHLIRRLRLRLELAERRRDIVGAMGLRAQLRAAGA